jgi:hypothetical protein
MDDDSVDVVAAQDQEGVGHSARRRRPLPARDLTNRMQLVLRRSPRVLLSDARAELDVRAHRLAERLVVGQSRFVDCLQVKGDEPLPLLVGDLEASVHLDDVPKSELAGEPVRPAERLGSEPGEVLDVMRAPLGEHVLSTGSARTLV